MTELDNDFKEKSKRRGRTSAIDFVVPLQLEECIHRIKRLPHKETFRFILWNTDDPDLAKFLLNCQLERQTAVEAKGQFKRWEGTSTRFEGEAQIISTESPFGELVLMVILPIWLSCPLMIFIPSLDWTRGILYALVPTIPIIWLLAKRVRQRRLRSLEKLISNVLLRDSKEF